MKTLLMTAVCLLAVCATAVAAPLEPADLPKEAKWVIHIDYDALNNTDLVEHLRDDFPEMAKNFRQCLQEELGVDPREELHGLTLFSESFEPHSGAAILHARYDRQKVESALNSKEEIQTSQWQNHTLYTCKMKKLKKSRGNQPTSQNSDSDNNGDRRKHAKKEVTIVMLDRNTIVAGCTKEEVKSVSRLLEGEEPSLKGVDSMLTKKAPKGAILYGSAIELDKISQREGVFPILQQHNRIVWAFGEFNNELFEKVILVADDEEVAGRMKKVVEGFVALAQVWAGEAQDLARLYEQNVEINQDGSTVRVDWHGDTQEVVAGLDQFKQRVEQWREAHRK